ncbi:MAG: hypothetical protein OSB21_11825 [Myxococcota bacterium]|nr:hypothetical protein [Myxococcota bacterium]
MLSRLLGPKRLRHLAGFIIFSMLSAMMVQKAYLQAAPIDRAELVSGELTKTEPMIRTIKGKDETRTLRLFISGQTRGFLIYPAIFAQSFDRQAFESQVPLGTKLTLQVAAEGLPVIYALRAGKVSYVDKEDTRKHLSGRRTFLRTVALAPCAMTLFSLFMLFRRED